MFKNYLKVALRNFWKKPGYSFINIFGLTIGLTCCLIIFQYVAFEYSFDRFHENEKNLYRVTTGMAQTGEKLSADGAFTPQSMAPEFVETIPEISRITRVHPEYQPALVSNPEQPEQVFEEEEIFYVDPAFLAMFSFPLTTGSVEGALEPGTVLLSESMAQKYFGNENPIGKNIDITGLTDKSYRIAGIFRDVPANSHLQFEILLPVEDLLRTEQYIDEPQGGWSYNNFMTYLQLHPDADRAEVNRKMTEVMSSNIEEMIRQRELRLSVEAQPLPDVHLNSDVVAPAGITSSYRTVYFFIIIALVTLLIALVNYVNLATARAVDRSREVGVRKVVGAHRNQLVKQFFIESALMNFLAIILAIALSEVIRPFVSDVAGIQLTNIVWMNQWFWLAIVATFVVSTLLAGLYPALVLSSFKPVSVLKGKGGTIASGNWLRKGLVIFQFAAAVILIGGTIVVYNQLNYMRNMDLGLDLEQVLTVDGPRVLPEGTDRATAMSTFTEELQRLPAVQQVATSASLPGQGFNWHGANTRRAEDDPNNSIRGVVTYIDTSFASLYDLQLLAGNGFSNRTISSGSDSPWPIIANETAVRSLGFSSPNEAVNHSLVIGDTDSRIIGVYKDFNWTSAHEERENIFFAHTNTGRHVSLRVNTNNLSSTISGIEEIYTQLFPGNVFSYEFVDEAFDAQYQNDQRFAKLFGLFAALAIAIACLGLFGLTSFTIQQRTKEIGIRKVLGATVPNLITRLSVDFLKLVIIAIVIGLVAVYLTMNRWLADFAYRIEMGPVIFLIAGGVAVLIALATVSLQSVRAALANPVDSLRSE